MTTSDFLDWLIDELERDSLYVNMDGRPFIFINELDRKPLIEKIEEKLRK